MSASWVPAALAALAVLAGACQSYNFNPVGQCIIQPGSSRFTLGSQTTADILFVVDDSGSMQPEQARLAANFRSFIDNLAQVQADRVAHGQAPFDFHIAITTSSVFEAWKPNTPTTCQQQSSGAFACHFNSRPTYPALNVPADVTCLADESGQACNDLIQQYYFPQASAASYCGNPGVGVSGAPFPAGDFVAIGANPRVLHFTKDLNWSSWHNGTSSDPTLNQLVQQFQQNVAVGSCGSGLEQHLEASRLALQKALKLEGKSQPAGVAADEWPHPGSKLVIVWVGDEDDCSNPNDPTKSLALQPGAHGNAPGDDVCTADQRQALASQKLFKVQEYADFFTGLGHSLGAAFVYSAQLGTCTADAAGNVTCTPGTCTCQCPPACTGGCGTGSAFSGQCQLDPTTCGGWMPADLPDGSRFHQLSAALRGAGASTYEASVCAGDWSATLNGIANLVRPPPGLTLPTTPASSDVTVLRIDGADGQPRRYCTGPGTAADWNFVDCREGTASAGGGTAVTSCVVINHATGHCEADPGETYVAQYLGRVPAGGCRAASDCTSAMGGKDSDWQCLVTSPDGSGTCLCQQ